MIQQIDESVIAININQTFKAGMNAQDKYDFTRGVWRLDVNRAKNAELAFTVYQGVVKEVYRIESWHNAGSTNYQNGRTIDPALASRFEFKGSVADNETRDRYLGKELPERHAQNPIKYYNC